MISVDQLQAGIIIPVDKPRQWTSFQAVNKIKAVIRNSYGLKKFKIGHAGTLDPLATGLLLVCVGKATKDITAIQDGDKEYTGTMVLGATTPCFDLEQAVDSYYPYEHITPELIEQVRHQFEGGIMQVPPMFSAVKVDGQRAYQYARRDDPSVTIQPKQVQVYRFEITAVRPGIDLKDTIDSKVHKVSKDLKDLKDTNSPHLYDNPQGEVPKHLPQIDFIVHCGKGTYIRSLARDFGAALGSGAFLSALRRTRVGKYSVDNALQLDQIQDYLLG